MNPLPHLAQRLFNVPLLIRPDKAELVMAALADRLGIAHLFSGGVEINMSQMLVSDDTPPASDRPYEVMSGVARIPVEGTLVHRLGCLHPYSGMTGYDGLSMLFLQALADPEVRAIAFDFDSPGGETQGVADLADMIFAARGTKPIWAILDESAYSAAYWLASACDRITIPRTGGTCNIGAIAMHTDISKALTGAGITVTVLKYGDLKGQGAEEMPLSPEGRAMFLRGVQIAGGLFAEAVARNRRLSRAAVDATQAGILYPEEAIAGGFVDAIRSPADAFAELVESLGASTGVTA